MINKVHLGDWTTNQLEDKSVQLIIADPPYFEVKGELILFGIALTII